MAHISYSKSIEILKANLPQHKGSETLFLGEAVGRILAEDVVAPYDNPYHPTASMDGYGVRYRDLEKGELKIVGENPAGKFQIRKIGEGEAVKTFTGSFMAEGADTLLPFENVKVEGEKLKIVEPVSQGFSVRPVGEDFKKGEVVIKKGTPLREGELGVLASLGKSVVKVVKRPKIAILSTGKELVDIDSPFQPGEIRSSNNYTLTFLAGRLGYQVENLGLLPDDKKEIEKRIKEALEENDIVVTTGGVSVGDYDFVKEITGSYQLLFHGVNIKPGQWVMVAKAGGKFIVSLPGFPYSSFVTFLLYVVPIADRLGGGLESIKEVTAKLGEPFEKKFKKYQFVAVNIHWTPSGLVVDTRGKKQGSSGILTNLIGCKGLMALPEGIYRLERGEEVKLLTFDRVI
ncbi:MAG: molybdopterin molybdenumtransferase MoeA [Epsilonproteobacteria bacterium]|nr:molybdopterin molybdenumtransferase MoeA [Campylobacterota bacterium]NPA88607.1 molybdopterin molybdotransferase MoeA [Campylobacterota bacterium]